MKKIKKVQEMCNFYDHHRMWRVQRLTEYQKKEDKLNKKRLKENFSMKTNGI